MSINSSVPDFYRPHPAHRDQTPRKSQWTISLEAEQECFVGAHASGWVNGLEAWGLHLPLQSPQYLGTAQDHTTPVFIARFVANSSPRFWHGYPLDHRRSTAHIPEARVLTQWITIGYLSKAKVRKIVRGQPCSL